MKPRKLSESRFLKVKTAIRRILRNLETKTKNDVFYCSGAISGCYRKKMDFTQLRKKSENAFPIQTFLIFRPFQFLPDPPPPQSRLSPITVPITYRTFGRDWDHFHTKNQEEDSIDEKLLDVHFFKKKNNNRIDRIRAV